jgi:hypothetical protein
MKPWIFCAAEASGNRQYVGTQQSNNKAKLLGLLGQCKALLSKCSPNRRNIVFPAYEELQDVGSLARVLQTDKQMRSGALT